MDSFDKLLYILSGVLLAFLLPPIIRLCIKRKSELYEDSDSILLNVQLNSRWMNMGFWETTDDFPTACSALAQKVSKKGDQRPGQSILDVGYGSGDSIIQWLRELSPSHVEGITSIPSQHAFSVKALAGEDVHGGATTRLIRGDAANLTTLVTRKFDKVLSVDAAYHFDTRQTFLRSSFDVLNPSGQLSMTDLLLADSTTPFDRLLLRIVCYFASVPFVNIITVGSHISQLESIGYEDILVEDISKSVFPGFLGFLERRDEGPLRGVLNGKWDSMMMYGKIVRWWSGAKDGRKRLIFVVVSARTPLVSMRKY